MASDETPPRIRSAGVALERLGLEHSSIVGAAGDYVRVQPVQDELEPHVIADIAATITLTRKDGRLARRDFRGPLLVCIVYGSLAQYEDGRLGFDSLTVGPLLRAVPAEIDASSAFAGLRPYRLEVDPAAAVTSALLRFVSPDKLLSAAVAELRDVVGNLRLMDGHPLHRALSERERTWAKRAERPKPVTRQRTSHEEIRRIAQRYISLVTLGERRPLPLIAREFGITREQARDRVHRARDLEYLEPSTAGKVHPRPGPKLIALGWKPPTPPPPEQSKGDTT